MKDEHLTKSASEPEPVSQTEPDADSVREGSTWMGWLLALVAVPLVYLLALPPIIFTIMKDGRTARSANLSKTVMLAVKPYDWLAESTPLKRPLYSYADWWRDNIFGSSAAMPFSPSPPPPPKAP